MKPTLFRRVLSAFLTVAVLLTAISLIGIVANAAPSIVPIQKDDNKPIYPNSISDASRRETQILDESIHIYHTLNLASDISVSFAVPRTALAAYDSYYMECTLSEYEGNVLSGTSTVRLEPVINGNYYYFTLTGITAIRMGDKVDAVLHMTKGDAEYISKTDTYSVATYAYAMLNRSTDSEMLSLCADLLRYGAEAQSYKGYRTDALVDASMTEVHRSYLSDAESLTFTATDSTQEDLVDPTITWVGKCLDLASRVGTKFVFNTSNYTGDISALSMKVRYQGSNGMTKDVTLTGAETYNAANNFYSFTFYGLLAAELRTVVDVTIYEGDTQLSQTLRYSAESYASKTVGTALEPLCKALFAYSSSARDVFAPPAPTTYSVTFQDWDGTVLKTETVESGKSATAPADPSRDGYVFVGWDKAFDNISSDLTVTALYDEIQITDPTIIVSNVTAKAGQTVEVAVLVKNNPGVAGGTLVLHFDDGLSISASSEGDAFAVLDYTSPAKLTNGCRFNWDSLDQESHEDGTLLLLTFTVPADAASGTVYNISVSYRNGDIYNVNLEDVEFDLVAGSVTVE